MTITVEYDLDMDHIDVSTAFLYADIQENVFVERAPGFVVKDNDGGELVMQLEKTLYGLAQSPGNFFHAIDPVLVDILFVPLKSDTCVYVNNRERVKIILTLYVDDLLLAGNNAEAMAIIKSQLNQRFKMTDMGEASFVLGIEIKRDRQLCTLTISQEAYSKSILERFGMLDCKPTSTPGYGLELSNQHPEDILLEEQETRRYQGIVGSCTSPKACATTSSMQRANWLARCLSRVRRTWWRRSTPSTT